MIALDPDKALVDMLSSRTSWKPGFEEEAQGGFFAAAGADPLGPMGDGASCLEGAIASGNEQAALALARSTRPAPAGPAIFDASLLKEAVRHEMPHLATLILGWSTEGSERSEAASLALHDIPPRAGGAIVMALIAAGADTERRNNAGLTPIARAASLDAPDALLALAAAGADIEARDHEGITPLMRAAAPDRPINRVQPLRALISLGADIDARDNHGRTALMRAAADGRVEFAKILLAAGADMDAVDNHGWEAERFLIQGADKAFSSALAHERARREAAAIDACSSKPSSSTRRIPL